MPSARAHQVTPSAQLSSTSTETEILTEERVTAESESAEAEAAGVRVGREAGRRAPHGDRTTVKPLASDDGAWSPQHMNSRETSSMVFETCGWGSFPSLPGVPRRCLVLLRVLGRFERVGSR